MGSPPRIAVIGGGVSASALVHGLRDELRSGRLSVSVFEMGRQPGGRATTRGTREKPELIINHGAPAFSAHTAAFRDTCFDLMRTGVLLRAPKEYAFGKLTADGSFLAEAAKEAEAPARFVASNGSMSSLAAALLRGGDAGGKPLARTFYSTMVGEMVFGTTVGEITSVCAEASEASEALRPAWVLKSKKGEPLGDFDFLVVSSATVGHPRWTATFGGAPPLAASAQADPALRASLDALAALVRCLSCGLNQVK